MSIMTPPLTPEQIAEVNKRIAEICGTRNSVRQYLSDYGGGYYDEDPNYYSSLDAMHEAILTQSPEFRLAFESILRATAKTLGSLVCECGADIYANIFLVTPPNKSLDTPHRLR